MLFVACAGVIEFTQSHKKDTVGVDGISASREKDDLSANDKGLSMTSNLRKRSVNNSAKSRTKVTCQPSIPVTHSSGYISFHTA